MNKIDPLGLEWWEDGQFWLNAGMVAGGVALAFTGVGLIADAGIGAGLIAEAIGASAEIAGASMEGEAAVSAAETIVANVGRAADIAATGASAVSTGIDGYGCVDTHDPATCAGAFMGLLGLGFAGGSLGTGFKAGSLARAGEDSEPMDRLSLGLGVGGGLWGAGGYGLDAYSYIKACSGGK